ncbi:MAG: hypothetical protein LBK72_10925 [Bifidobacteriaceae bacterium]|nr:hypothetical protein [Bifidobacteriaceae bacterium]
MTVRGAGVCGAVIGALIALAGCTAADDDVASVGALASPPASPAPVLAPQRERAEAMAACLAGASISTSLSDQDDGQTRLDIDPSPGPFAWVLADGTSTQATDAESTEMADAAIADGRSLLWLGGADRTDEYDACVAETQFTQPGPFADPATEQRVKQLQTDLNNDFAACARANGFPEVEDQPPPVLDGGATTLPSDIVLPLTMTEEELRGLLTVCPPYDENRVRAVADGLDGVSSWVEEHVMGPVLTFGFPGDDGTREWTDADLERWEDLAMVKGEEADRQLEALIVNLQAEGITYQGPRPESRQIHSAAGE